MIGPFSSFNRNLEKFFDKKTQKAVSSFFKGFPQPAPRTHREYKKGAEGLLTFLNPYGLTLKVENKYSKGTDDTPPGLRISHSHIVQPVLQVDAFQAFIEIYPGIDIENITPEEVQLLIDILENDGINSHDNHYLYVLQRNMGRLPSLGDKFPDPQPANLDRLSVSSLNGIEQITHRLDVDYYLDPTNEDDQQYHLYKPLHTAFNEAWDPQKHKADPKKMRAALLLCQEFKAEGKLFTGWLNQSEETGSYTPGRIQKKSLAYERRLKTIPHHR